MAMNRLSITLVIVACILFATVHAKTELRVDTMNILASELYSGNILPQFLFSQGTVEGGGTNVVLNPNGGRGVMRPATADESCLPDIWDGIMEDVRAPPLPYLLQSHWGCDPLDHELDVVVLENDKIKAQITPGINGKVWSLYDKVNKRDMVMNNTRKHMANIGTLKAWSAGGIEFNHSPGIIGHAAFSESPVYVAQLDTEKGPAVRVYEFDRYNSTIWQVDILLDDDVLWIHPRLINPTEDDLRGYWWTCVAHNITPEDRVVGPSDSVTSTESGGGLREAKWPYMSGMYNTTFSGRDKEWLIDHSWLGSIFWGDFFLRIPEGTDRWIQHTRKDSYNVHHSAPDLKGQKLFTWGNNGMGRFMQDFLGHFPGDRSSDYIELQVGPVNTQMQNWPFPKNSHREWTESFKGWMANAEERAKLTDPDYKKAVDVTTEWFDSPRGIPKTKRKEMDDFMKKLADREVKKENVLFFASDWGYLDAKLRQKAGKGAFPKSVYFGPENEISYDARPWFELLEHGSFSAKTLQQIPSSYQVSELWRLAIEESMITHGATWLHLLHLAIIEMEKGMVTEPRSFLKQSMALKPNPIAARNLALLSKTEEDAYRYFLEAWRLALDSPKTDVNHERMLYYLGSEIAQFLQQTAPTQPNFRTYLAEFIGKELTRPGVPPTVLQTDSVLTSRIAVALYQKKPEDAIAILGKECFPTYGRARKELIAYWNNAHVLVASMKAGRELNRAEQYAVRKQNPVPKNIGCAYADLVGACNYW